MSEEMLLVGSPFEDELRDADEIDGARPETLPSGDGELYAPNGVVTMEYDGEYRFYPTRHGWKPDQGIVLEVSGPGIDGEVELEPLEAPRLGMGLLAHAEAEYDEM